VNETMPFLPTRAYRPLLRLENRPAEMPGRRLPMPGLQVHPINRGRDEFTILPSKEIGGQRTMTEGTNAGAAPTPTKPKRTATTGSQGGGDFLKADVLGTRGREFQIAGTSWEENYDKTELIPCLHVIDTTGTVNDGEERLFKITTKGNNKVLADNGGGGEDLSPLHGHTVYLMAAKLAPREGEATKFSIQIVEFDGKTVA
jgi:hypothetical protein